MTRQSAEPPPEQAGDLAQLAAFGKPVWPSRGRNGVPAIEGKSAAM
ncbi:MAG TPA: hypothetical protein VFE60_07815 [Roseiarcus sp.]|nr:hypothetical protein [Roseiarcus sp.]